MSMRISLAIGMALAAVLAAGVRPRADADVELEAAIHREIVEGDLAGALEEYRTIVARADASRTVRAKAFLEIGLCEEKLGQRKEAYDTYRRVATEYADQGDVVSLARMKLAAWSGPRNLKFEEGAAGRVPPGWFVPSLPKDADYLAELRRGDDGCRKRSGCALVMVPRNVPGATGTLMQSFSAAAYAGKTVRLRAWLRLERFFLTTAGFRIPEPGDHAQMWLNAERANRKILFSDDMHDRPVTSADWTRCEIVGEIGDDARFINFGMMSIGGGRLWVDDVSFDVISRAEFDAARSSQR